MCVPFILFVVSAMNVNDCKSSMRLLRIPSLLIVYIHSKKLLLPKSESSVVWSSLQRELIAKSYLRDFLGLGCMDRQEQIGDNVMCS